VDAVPEVADLVIIPDKCTLEFGEAIIAGFDEPAMLPQ
jgi:hypothetical protein